MWYGTLSSRQVAVPFTAYSMVFDLSQIDVVVAVHAVLALYHTFTLSKMAVISLLMRQLVFSQRSSTRRSSSSSSIQTLRQRLTTHWVYVTFLSRRGILGLESAHFNAVFAVREIIETLLQTLQAYRLSQFVARRDINNFFVALLVINCWITPLIQQRFARRVALQRLLCLTADITLDFASSVLISSVLLVPYVHQFDWRVGDFPMTKWYDLRWLITAMNEFQLIHVTSWGDLLMRLLFSVSMILSMNKVKYLLRRPAPAPASAPAAETADKQTGDVQRKYSNDAMRSKPATAKVAVATGTTTTTTTTTPTTTESAAVSTPSPSPSPSPSPRPPPPPTTTKRHRAMSLVLLVFDVALVSWGAIVLVAFVVARQQRDVPECAMQTRPWFTARPACALLEVACSASETTAELALHRQQLVLNEVQPSTVMSLVLRDCAALHVTPLLADLHELVGLKISNSAIVDWSGDATLRDAQHPRLLFVFMERVTFRDGSLPDGLQARDFPRRLLDIEVCVSNLGALPADLDEKWAPGGIVFIERSALTQVPDVLLRMEISGLSLHGNRITDVPVELLRHPTVGFVRLDANPIRSLPALAPAELSPVRVCLDDSQLDGPLPAWVTPALGDRVVARRTPLCANASAWGLDSAAEICAAPEFISCPAYPLH
ncbi:hypothetical protein PINS_up006023 [Pythium insidiosum]|nr:hypothetical protein PINS_up006023 [Pythium insidiosum]